MDGVECAESLVEGLRYPFWKGVSRETEGPSETGTTGRTEEVCKNQTDGKIVGPTRGAKTYEEEPTKVVTEKE